MKSYISIDKVIRSSIDIYACAKYDGSQIRAEWSPKNGFYKFGTKTRLIDEKEPLFGKAIPLIKESYEKDLTDIFKKQKYESAVCFFEFLGPNSFAGRHNENDAFEVIFFDITPYKKPILDPNEFYKLFSSVRVAEVLYIGKANATFVESVRNSTLEGMPEEGVICKAKNPKKGGIPIMFKIKSNIWLDKLKDFCKDDLKLFEELA